MANIGKQITFHSVDGDYQVTAIGYFVSDNEIILNSIQTSNAFDEDGGYPMPLQVGLPYSTLALADYFVTTLDAELGMSLIVSTDADTNDFPGILDDEGTQWEFEHDGVVLENDGDAIAFGDVQLPFGVPVTKTFKLRLQKGGSIFELQAGFNDGTNFSVASLPYRVNGGTEIEFTITYDGQATPVTDFVGIAARYWDDSMSNFIINFTGTNAD